jgi:hypothetical protein
LIGTIRRECLDRLLFWTAMDLELKLCPFTYYNQHRTHAALNGTTPIETTESKGLDLKSYRWQTHCAGYTKRRLPLEQKFATDRTQSHVYTGMPGICYETLKCHIAGCSATVPVSISLTAADVAQHRRPGKTLGRRPNP